MATSAYSFQSVNAHLTSASAAVNVNLGNGATVHEEGIEITQADDKNTMKMGADGNWLNILHPGNGGTVTVNLLRNSPSVKALTVAYNLERVSQTLWGQDIIRIENKSSHDSITCVGCAFKKFPDIKYSKDSEIVKFVFDVGQINYTMGTY